MILKLVKDTKKWLKNIGIKDQPQKRDALSDIYVKQAGLTIIKNAIDAAKKRAIPKNMCLTNALFLNHGEIEQEKKQVATI